MPSAKVVQKVFDKERYVFTTTSQWWEFDGDNIQSIVEILPKRTFLD